MTAKDNIQNYCEYLSKKSMSSSVTIFGIQVNSLLLLHLEKVLLIIYCARDS